MDLLHHRRDPILTLASFPCGRVCPRALKYSLVLALHARAELRKQLQQHFSVMCSKHALMWPKTAAEARGPRPQLRTRALDSVVRRMTSQNGWQRMRVRKDEVSEDEA